MDPAAFELVLSWVAPYIQKSLKWRPTATPAERLCVTHRYLATEDVQFTIASSYRISPATLCRIVRETTQVPGNALLEKGYPDSSKSEKETTGSKRIPKSMEFSELLLRRNRQETSKQSSTSYHCINLL